MKKRGQRITTKKCWKSFGISNALASTHPHERGRFNKKITIVIMLKNCEQDQSHIPEHNVQWLITDLCTMRKHVIDSKTFTSVIKLIYKLKSVVSNQPLAPPQRSLAVSCALNKEELWKEMILPTPPATQRLIFNTWPFFNISFLSQKPFHGQNAIMHLQNWIMVWLDWKCHQTTGCTCT